MAGSSVWGHCERHSADGCLAQQDDAWRVFLPVGQVVIKCKQNVQVQAEAGNMHRVLQATPTG